MTQTAMPRQKPGRSRQDYETPPDFIRAVERRFGPITWDLAASATNAKAPLFFTKEQDTLAQDWTRCTGVCWLNPEFADIAPYAKKCRWSLSPHRDRTILLLTPASVGADWWAKHVHGYAYSMPLFPRLTFVGEKDVYPKDLLLSVFGGGHGPGFSPWRWK